MYKRLIIQTSLIIVVRHMHLTLRVFCRGGCLVNTTCVFAFTSGECLQR